MTAETIEGLIKVFIFFVGMFTGWQFRARKARKDEAKVVIKGKSYRQLKKRHDTEQNIGRRFVNAIRGICPVSRFWVQSHEQIGDSYCVTMGRIGSSGVLLIRFYID